MRLIAETGGSAGVRDLDLLASAVGRPQTSFGGQDLYPDLCHKAAALLDSLVRNHPFVDGNKRVGHAAMEAFLRLNGHEFTASSAEAEAAILGVAAGRRTQDDLLAWVGRHVRRVAPPA